MDKKDRTILEYLIENGRDKISDIARTLDMPRVTVHERIQGMLQKGIIQKFTLVPDFEALGIPFVAFVFVGFRPSSDVSQRELAERISRMSEVEEVHIIAGEWDLLIKARAKSLKEIGNLVLDRLREMEGVERTETVTIFQTVK